MVRFQLSACGVQMGDVPRRINVRGQSGVSSNLRVCTLDAGSKCVPVSKEKRPILDKFAGSRLGFGGRRSRVVRDNLAGRGIRILPDPNHWRNMVGEFFVERKLDFSSIRILSILENPNTLPTPRARILSVSGLISLPCGFSAAGAQGKLGTGGLFLAF